MVNLRILLLAPALLLLTGCDQKAIEFAKQVRALLGEYRKGVDAQLTESNKYYERAATFEALRARRVTLGNLEAERNERATALEADFRGNRRYPSLYRTYLREYADKQYAETAEWLSADTDAVAPYLQRLVALENDQAVLDAFEKSLQALEKPRSLADEGRDIKKFVDGTKGEFDRMVCADLKGRIGRATGEDLKNLKTMFADKKCDAVLKSK